MYSPLRKCLSLLPSLKIIFIQSVFTHVASIYANLLRQKKAFASEKSSTPTGLVWNTNMAAFSLFWKTNMAAVTSCQNALYAVMSNFLLPRDHRHQTAHC